MYWKLGCCSSVEEPDDPASLWLGLRIENGSHESCFAAPAMKDSITIAL
jgi:hypothetical protein